MADFPLRENHSDKLKQLKLQQQQRIPYKKVCEAAWFANMKMKYLEDEKSMWNILFFFRSRISSYFDEFNTKFLA